MLLIYSQLLLPHDSPQSATSISFDKKRLLTFIKVASDEVWKLVYQKWKNHTWSAYGTQEEKRLYVKYYIEAKTVHEAKFNGEIGGKPVKTIVKDKGYKMQWFAKPKDFGINTPHFEQKIDGTLEAHQDSADGKSFRVLSINAIYSGSFYSGTTFAANMGMDMLALPMKESANGFAINTSLAGCEVVIPSSEEWCLMAYGTFGPWTAKPPKPERK